jgi:hypothetical protein
MFPHRRPLSVPLHYVFVASSSNLSPRIYAVRTGSSARHCPSWPVNNRVTHLGRLVWSRLQPCSLTLAGVPNQPPLLQPSLPHNQRRFSSMNLPTCPTRCWLGAAVLPSLSISEPPLGSGNGCAQHSFKLQPVVSRTCQKNHRMSRQIENTEVFAKDSSLDAEMANGFWRC